TGRMRELYLDGDDVALAGRVWPEFSFRRHVREHVDIFMGRRDDGHSNQIWRSWDFGYRHPAVTWHQIDRERDRWNVLAELEGEDIAIGKFTKEVMEYEQAIFGQRGVQIGFRNCGDPAGNQTSDKSEMTSAEIVRHITGSAVLTSNMGVMPMVELVRHRLVERDDAFGIHRRCKRTIDGLDYGYVWNERTGRPEKDGNFDHLMDTLQYFAAVHMGVGVVHRDKPREQRSEREAERDWEEWMRRLRGDERQRRPRFRIWGKSA
ncbi:MAG: hypothetical protein AB1552_14050, partial [Nitrospirota bacterium]